MPLLQDMLEDLQPEYVHFELQHIADHVPGIKGVCDTHHHCEPQPDDAQPTYANPSAQTQHTAVPGMLEAYVLQSPNDGDLIARALELPAAQCDEALHGQGQVPGEAVEKPLAWRVNHTSTNLHLLNLVNEHLLDELGWASNPDLMIDVQTLMGGGL